jgi:hypothetical protein
MPAEGNAKGLVWATVIRMRHGVKDWVASIHKLVLAEDALV